MKNQSRIYFFVILILVLTGYACNNQNRDETIGEESLIQVSPGVLKAGDEVILDVIISIPDGGIAEGGGILFPFYMKPWDGLLKGVSADKKLNKYVSAERSDGGELEIVNVQTNPEWDILSDLKVFVRGSDVSEGEKIKVTFGNEDQKVMVKRKQKSFFLEVELDTEGNGEYKFMDPPDLPIAEAAPVKLFVTAPSHVSAGEDFEVVIYTEDKYNNVCETYKSLLDIHTLSDSARYSMTYQARSWDVNKDLDRNSFTFSLDEEGIYYIRVSDAKLGLNAVSNPVKVYGGSLEKNLYWGEIHVHSQLSDGGGELQDLYRDGYARGLDFVAITDHNFGRGARGTREERIREICAEAERFNLPGKFVSIPAGETHFFPLMHVNFYFDRADPDYMIDLVNSIDEVTENLGREWQDKSVHQLMKDVEPYWEIFDNEPYAGNTLVIPHHTMWWGIKPFINADRMKLIEIYSTHGTSEVRDQKNVPDPLKMEPGRLQGDPERKFSARELLDENMPIGFVGGSDNHSGQSGFNAITGVYGEELTRKTLVSYLYEKDCYATTSNRTLITIEPAGDEYFISVAGDGDIDVVEVISNGETMYQSAHKPGRILEFQWTPRQPEGYFYIRVYLNDGHEAAWSSPVWL